MKIITLSIDKKILEKGSDVDARFERYGKMVDQIDVILPNAVDENPVNIRSNVTVHPLSGPKLFTFFRAISLAKKLTTPDSIISVQDPFELGIWGLIVSWITKRPLNVQVHIDFMSPHFKSESSRQRIQAIIAPFVLRRASSVRVVSQKIAEYLRHDLHISPRKITIAPVMVNTGSMVSKPVTIDLHKRFPEFEFIVLVAARYVKQKNIPLAIEAFDLLKEKYPRIGLVIAGSGPEELAIKKSVEDKNLQRTVRVGSWTSEFASCMKTGDVFLMSSDYEGWGMTIIEASALEKPIIMTNVGCAGEFLINERNGLVVPVRDPGAIAAVIERYFKNRQFAAKMGQEAQKMAMTYMTSEENDKLIMASWNQAVQGQSQ